MNIPKQLINLLGAVVVIGVVVAGIALIALPMYGSSQTTDASARTVAQTNDVYDVQVQTLAAERERMDEITADLTSLRRQIAAIPQLDDVFEIVIASAADTGATITSVTASDPEPWAPRGGATDDPTATAPAGVADESAADATVPAELEPTASETNAPDPAATAPTDGATAPSPTQQVPLTIVVELADASQAAAFIDALGRGPRLLAPIDGTLADGTLTVTALAFIRTED
ncbi:hypothetical protein HF576_18900 [Microbacterium sp. CFH 90308]|uniref:Tfp pilus assembly protein PilO n=1 Tax=Microbacterium salsuginis TaxID=2722803 RepID=A0ABX1KFR7_9MICO|nr:hypothetical protein [Microbacterium sp. CFH 90308]NLP85904.1 hypothetical protein [Microbacterium sp. CFH 90308]